MNNTKSTATTTFSRSTDRSCSRRLQQLLSLLVSSCLSLSLLSSSLLRKMIQQMVIQMKEMGHERRRCNSSSVSQQQQQQLLLLDKAIRTNDIWLLRSIAVSSSYGFINDTYRQQIWPIVVREQQGRREYSSFRRQLGGGDRDGGGGGGRTEVDIGSSRSGGGGNGDEQQQQQQREEPQPPPIAPISPCSVVLTTLALNDNDDDDGIVHKNSKNISSSSINNDRTIMWYDLQRWHPPRVSVTDTVAEHNRMKHIIHHHHHLHEQQQQQFLDDDYRYLLSFVIEESLQPEEESQPQFRYYQGYHMIAGLILTTFLANTTKTTTASSSTTSSRTNSNSSSNTEMEMTTYATTDTIELLQHIIRTIPFIYDMVQPDTDTNHGHGLERIVQHIRQTIIPLYYYYCNYYYNHHHHSNGPVVLDDETEQYIIGQCVSWILTLFGSTTGSSSSRCCGHISKNHHGHRQQQLLYMDAILASHPYYCITYLCVSKLIQEPRSDDGDFMWDETDDHNGQHSSSSCSYESNTLPSATTIISHAIRLMELIPPHTIQPKVVTWWNQFHGGGGTHNHFHDDQHYHSFPKSDTNNFNLPYDDCISGTINSAPPIQQITIQSKTTAANELLFRCTDVSCVYLLQITRPWLWITTITMFIRSIRKRVQYLYRYFRYYNAMIANAALSTTTTTTAVFDDNCNTNKYYRWWLLPTTTRRFFKRRYVSLRIRRLIRNCTMRHLLFVLVGCIFFIFYYQQRRRGGSSSNSTGRTSSGITSYSFPIVKESDDILMRHSITMTTIPRTHRNISTTATTTVFPVANLVVPDESDQQCPFVRSPFDFIGATMMKEMLRDLQSSAI